jgi:hypothetical protein
MEDYKKPGNTKAHIERRIKNIFHLISFHIEVALERLESYTTPVNLIQYQC